MGNRWGINLWNWVNELGPQCTGLAEKAFKMGFTAVELPMTISELPPKLADEIHSLDMEVSLCASLGAGRDLSSFDEAVRQNTMEYMVGCLKSAEAVSAKVFAGPLYTGGGKRHLLSEEDKKREWELAVTGIRKVSAIAKECGVRLALEPLNRYRTSVVNTAAQALKLVSDIGEENVGVHFDTYQAGIEEDSVTDAFEAVLKEGKLYHFHACSNNRGVPGQGFYPWEDLWNLMRTYDYRGHITMETFVAGGFDGGWIELGKSRDEIAESGIRYMREHDWH
ncbi:sugar phosphate isomerase/epimerase family protein [Lachnospiraceae bacterium 54-53]